MLQDLYISTIGFIVNIMTFISSHCSGHVVMHPTTTEVRSEMKKKENVKMHKQIKVNLFTNPSYTYQLNSLDSSDMFYLFSQVSCLL